MAWKFEPDVVKDGFYEGYVLVNFPGYQERNTLAKSVYFKHNQKTGAEVNENSFDIKMEIDKIVVDRILEVNLKRVKCGTEYKTVEAMDQNPELAGVLSSIGTFIMQGITLSKNL